MAFWVEGLKVVRATGSARLGHKVHVRPSKWSSRMGEDHKPEKHSEDHIRTGERPLRWRGGRPAGHLQQNQGAHGEMDQVADHDGATVYAAERGALRHPVQQC